MGIYKRKQKVRKQELDQESDQEKEKKLSFFLVFFNFHVFFYTFPPLTVELVRAYKPGLGNFVKKRFAFLSITFATLTNIVLDYEKLIPFKC